jgi:hypothetical protein
MVKKLNKIYILNISFLNLYLSKRIKKIIELRIINKKILNIIY